MKDLKSKPEIIVFAGPNGSGKSTEKNLNEADYEDGNTEKVPIWGFFLLSG